MIPKPRTWRAEPVKGRLASGAVSITSWRLVAGRAGDRIRLNLGKSDTVDAILAERCADAMNTEEKDTVGTRMYDRIVRYAKEHPSEQLLRVILNPEADLLGEPTVDHGAMTVSEYFDEVFWPVRKESGTDIGVARSTAAAEEGYWRNKAAGRGILQGEIGRCRMRDLNDQHWVRWEASQTQLSGRAKVLRRNAYAALLSYARKQGHISYRPEFFRIKGATKRTREQQDPLSLKELMALIDAATKPVRGGYGRVPDPTRRAMWAVGAGLGLRPGELSRLEWSDVNWTDRVLLVRGTKTEESHDTVPMTPIALRELSTLWVHLERPTTGRCFTYRGKPFVQFKMALATDAKAAKIERHVTPYLLRHSFATIAWSLGIEMDVARRILRHADEKMLREVYCRPRPADLVDRVSAFDVPRESSGTASP